MSKQREGFGSKRNRVMEVDPDEVVAMQRGYEERLKRQAASLTRVVDLLQQRTDDVAEHMRRANEAAQWQQDDVPIEHYRIIDRPVVGDLDAEGVLSRLIRELVPAEWDLYNEDDTAETIIIGYVHHLQKVIDVQTKKMDASEAKVASLQNELNRAQEDAMNNARVANANARNIEIGDEDPPWAEPQQAFSAQADHTGSSVWSDAPGDGDRETLEWPGASPTMATNEQRPGSF